MPNTSQIGLGKYLEKDMQAKKINEDIANGT